jgi:hypothetical protein
MAFIKPPFPRLQRGKTVSAGLVGAWPCYEKGGSILRDVGGSGHDGTLIDGPQWVAGQHGQALSFDGSGQYVALPRLVSAFPVTVSVWVKPNTLGSRQTIWQIGDLGNINVVLDSAAQQILSGPQGGQAADLALLSVGRWSNITVIYWDTGSTQRVFVNGADCTVTSKDWWGVIGDRLGCGYNGYARFPFNGVLDDFRVYNRALSQSEISLIASGLG